MKKDPWVLSCDICGKHPPGTESVILTAGNRRLLTADLCPRHLAQFRRVMAPYLAIARPARKQPQQTPPVAYPQSLLTRRIRAWALENGYDVQPLGNLPREVKDAYFDVPGQEEKDMRWLDEQRAIKRESYRKSLYRMPPECTVDGCTGRPAARELCWMHLQRWYRHGDPLKVVSEFRGRKKGQERGSPGE